MTESQAFASAAWSRPDDAAPALVWADWLEERGDRPRAEFVRVQCELERTPPTDPRYVPLHAAERDLLREHERDWLGPWHDSLVRWEYRRGFVRHVSVTPDVFARDGAALFREHPIDAVSFVNTEGESLSTGHIRRVVGRPEMERVRELEVAGCRADDAMFGMFGGRVMTGVWMTALANAPHVRNLQSVSFAGGTRSGREAITARPFRAFCSARHLAGLKSLHLHDLYQSEDPEELPDLMATLAGASFRNALTSLNLAGCWLTDDALRPLVGRLPKLAALNLSRCDCLGPTVSDVVIPRAGTLRELSVPPSCDLAALAEWHGAASLTALTIDGSARFSETGRGLIRSDGRHFAPPQGRDVSADEWAELLRSPRLRPRRFTVDVHPSYEIPFDVLASAPWLPAAEEVRVAVHHRQSPPSLSAVLRTLRGGGLRSVGRELDVMPVPEQADWLRASSVLAVRDLPVNSVASLTDFCDRRAFPSTLRRLNLSGVCQTDADTAAVADCRELADLRHLEYGHNPLTPATVDGLATSAFAATLEVLSLSSVWGRDDGEGDVVAALTRLADPALFPRLRDVVVGSGTAEDGVRALRRRFGPRLRVFSDC